MNIFSDFHHSSLFTSLELLFEKRLGHTLYHPVGMEWYPDFWKIGEPYGELGVLTANQYLTLKGDPDKEGIYHFDNMNGITLEKFKEMPIDVIIASVPQNIKPYKLLIEKYHPEAKFVFQMGNMFNEVLSNLHDIPNLLSSTINFPVPSTCNAVFYHQEFSLDVFKPQGKKPLKKMASFVNCLPQTGHIGKYLELKQMFPDYDIKMYGASCDDGIVATTQEIANIMNECKFGIHLKYLGDGMGHIVHNWYACGRPVIINYDTYKNQLAGKLLIPDETCIVYNENSNASEVIEKIRSISPLKYEWMCQRSYEIFKEKVDFDREEVELRKFIDNLR